MWSRGAGTMVLSDGRIISATDIRIERDEFDSIGGQSWVAAV